MDGWMGGRMDGRTDGRYFCLTRLLNIHYVHLRSSYEILTGFSDLLLRSVPIPTST
jgi:hypothetical protein